jgi:hypothetical protein
MFSTNKNDKELSVSKKTTDNERLHASGGVCPQKHLWEFGSLSPAGTFVNPRPRQAATPLYDIAALHTSSENLK